MSSHDVETYCDARGVEMPAMSFSDALRRLLALATRNLPDEHDLARDSGLYEEKRRLEDETRLYIQSQKLGFGTI